MWFGKKKQAEINNQLANQGMDFSKSISREDFLAQLNALNQLNNPQPVQSRPVQQQAQPVQQQPQQQPQQEQQPQSQPVQPVRQQLKRRFWRIYCDLCSAQLVKGESGVCNDCLELNRILRSLPSELELLDALARDYDLAWSLRREGILDDVFFDNLKCSIRREAIGIINTYKQKNIAYLNEKYLVVKPIQPASRRKRK